MVVVLSLGLDPAHHDYDSLKRLENKIIEHAKGWERFKRDIPNLIRQGIDEVIDAARTRRFTLDELEKIEKNYISAKLKILVRHHLGLERGRKLDLLVDGVEVGIANSIGSRWNIPKEGIGRPYILIKENEKTAQCSFGLTVIRAGVMNNEVKQHRYKRIAREAFLPVRWILRDEPYPKNSWEDVYTEPR